MKRILILIIGIVLIKPLSADCQEVLIERDILVRVISQLDSFEVLKKLEKEYIAFQDSCIMLTGYQSDYIKTQDRLILNKDEQIKTLELSSKEYQQLVVINEELVESYKKKYKKSKTNTIISLVGGGVLTIGLTTSLLISLL